MSSSTIMRNIRENQERQIAQQLAASNLGAPEEIANGIPVLNDEALAKSIEDWKATDISYQRAQNELQREQIEGAYRATQQRLAEARQADKRSVSNGSRTAESSGQFCRRRFSVTDADFDGYISAELDSGNSATGQTARAFQSEGESKQIGSGHRSTRTRARSSRKRRPAFPSKPSGDAATGTSAGAARNVSRWESLSTQESSGRADGSATRHRRALRWRSDHGYAETR